MPLWLIDLHSEPNMGQGWGLKRRYNLKSSSYLRNGSGAASIGIQERSKLLTFFIIFLLCLKGRMVRKLKSEKIDVSSLIAYKSPNYLGFQDKV